MMATWVDLDDRFFGAVRAFLFIFWLIIRLRDRLLPDFEGLGILSLPTNFQRDATEAGQLRTVHVPITGALVPRP